jgi:phytoene dehydrogenase-like protein
MSGDFDAIVIGAGHNGLVAAARLAKEGKRVVVLETSPVVGGLLGGSDPVAAMPFGIHPKIHSGLGLARHGLRYGAPMKTLSLGGEGRVEIDGAVARGVSQAMAANYADLHRKLARYSGALARMLTKAPPRFRDGGVGDMLTMAQLGLSIRGLGKADMRDMLRIILSNVWDLCEDEIGDGPLAAALAMDATLGGGIGPRSPGTVLTLLYRMASTGSGGAGQRSTPVGGAAAVVSALVKAAETSGAAIRTSAPVARILVDDNDRAIGVALENGEEIRAPLILSNATPRRTLLDLLGPQHLNAEDVARLRHMATNGMVARLDLDLAELPAGLTEADLAHRIVVAGDMRQVERAFNAAKYGELPAVPAVEFTGRKTENGWRLAALAQFAPSNLKGGWSKAKKDRLAKSVIKVLDGAIPGFGGKITGAEVRSPTDLEATYGLTGGHWHHGELRIDQMLMMRPFAGAAQYRMPVAGLYLCGAGAHPGGDISGLPAWNAAGQAIKDGGAQ